VKLTIHLFAGLSDIFENNQISIHITDDKVTVNQLKQMIMEQFPQTAQLVQQAFLAKNHTYAKPDEVITENDEIALIPPVSGG
jgi:molybdopterin converting factor subunit 1